MKSKTWVLFDIGGPGTFGAAETRLIELLARVTAGAAMLWFSFQTLLREYSAYRMRGLKG